MNASYPKRNLKPLVIALTLALSTSAALAERYEGYVPMQQEIGAVNVGSGYTADETISQNAQSGADVPVAENDVTLMPGTMDVSQDSLALNTPYQAGSGYTSVNRSAAVIIIADSTTVEGN